MPGSIRSRMIASGGVARTRGQHADPTSRLRRCAPPSADSATIRSAMSLSSSTTSTRLTRVGPSRESLRRSPAASRRTPRAGLPPTRYRRSGSRRALNAHRYRLAKQDRGVTVDGRRRRNGHGTPDRSRSSAHAVAERQRQQIDHAQKSVVRRRVPPAEWIVACQFVIPSRRPSRRRRLAHAGLPRCVS